MTDVPGIQPALAGARTRRPARMNVWRSIRRPLAQSRLVKAATVRVLKWTLEFVRLTNRRVDATDERAEALRHAPSIAALWHGQHLLAPALYPRDVAMAAMVSRSADAELNAGVIEAFGFQAIRGSGGRPGATRADKGGARALLALKKALDAGKSVSMIADIPHGTPRDAGMGIVTLARLSGRPIIPIAIATSRRKVLEKTWDRTTINLPFGRSALIVGKPVSVPPEASDAQCDALRQELSRNLDEATAEAYRLVDTRP
ncbi:MAG: lysophospholipid acyltransferase family protein [Rhizobiaceae bacterium]|nr:lysophospholipid acyltransferase family protein [Rhizobiaceae bacterium]